MSGIIWAFIAEISFGLFQTINRKAGIQINVFYHTFFLMIISTVFMVLSTLIIEDIKHLILLLTWKGIFYFAIAGMIHFVFGWTLLTVSQKQIGASRTSALVGTAPLFATLIGYLVFNEILSFNTLIGIICIVAGFYLVTKNEDWIICICDWIFYCKAWLV